MEARKYSKKREAILEALRNTTEHPSAEMLYARLKPEFPDLSLGTVYRNLAMFIRDGDAVSVGTVAGQERYDADTHPARALHLLRMRPGAGRLLPLPQCAGQGGRARDGRRGLGTLSELLGTCQGCLNGQKTAV